MAMTEQNYLALLPRPYVNLYGDGVFKMMQAFERHIKKERKRIFPNLYREVHDTRDRYRQSLGAHDQHWWHNRAIDCERLWTGAAFVAAHSLGLIRVEGRAVHCTDEGRKRLADMKARSGGAVIYDDLAKF